MTLQKVEKLETKRAEGQDQLVPVPQAEGVESKGPVRVTLPVKIAPRTLVSEIPDYVRSALLG
ncbi:hypothetical protein E4U61_002723 [Claviceps capensis]|nr:hypothetical protein E4U61_002723 [Claviceps capensis]